MLNLENKIIKDGKSSPLGGTFKMVQQNVLLAYRFEPASFY